MRSAGVGPAALAALVLTVAGAVRAAEGETTPWSYAGVTGPEHWSALSPEFRLCAQGRLQSPIDIRGAAELPYVPLAFQYRSQPLEAINDGRGVYLPIPPGSTLNIRGETHALGEIHFHVPGEHRLDGETAAAEIHLMHRSAQGGAISVAVPIRAGHPGNATLARIVERLPLSAGEQVYYRQVGINPLFVLPTRRSYFAYSGSLTQPPCSEPVSWILLAQPVDLEPDLLARLTRATGTNARPVQPLNERPVYAYPYR